MVTADRVLPIMASVVLSIGEGRGGGISAEQEASSGDFESRINLQARDMYFLHLGCLHKDDASRYTPMLMLLCDSIQSNTSALFEGTQHRYGRSSLDDH